MGIPQKIINDYVNLKWRPLPFKIWRDKESRELLKRIPSELKDTGYFNNEFDYKKYNNLILDNQICIVTGQVSGIIVIDIDNKIKEGVTNGIDSWKELISIYGEPNTVKATSPSGGFHYFFKYNPKYSYLSTDSECFRYEGNVTAIDIRTNKGVIVVEPSIYDGKQYKWINSPFNTPLAELPEWLLKYHIPRKNNNANPYDTTQESLLFQGPKGQAKMFCNEFKDKLYITHKDTAYFYSELTKLWEEIPSSVILTLIMNFLEDELIKELKKTKGMGKELANILKLIRDYNYAKNVFIGVKGSELYKPSFIKELNTISYLLPIKDKLVVDLRTMTIRDRTKEDKFSFFCPVNLLQNNPLESAEKFFKQIMYGHEENTRYFQKQLGYCITGEVNSRCFFIWYGQRGANGKGTVRDLLMKILNKFYITLDESILIQKDNNSSGNANPFLMKLMGARLGVLSEVDENVKLNEKQIKRLSGNDPITTRQLYGEAIEFIPILKMIGQFNEKPKLNTNSEAMKDRLKYMEFKTKFTDDGLDGTEKKDIEFVDSLLNEKLDEVFTWLCIGAKEYYKDWKLQDPDNVKELINNYINELDTIKQFIDNKCIKDNSWVKSSNFYEPYVQFCKSEGLEILTQCKFFKEMKRTQKTKVLDGYTFYNFSLVLENLFN